MIYQPRNVQPSSISIDGTKNNTFTMEVQTNSYISAYQLYVVDFSNKAVYSGSKITLSNKLYNGDTLSIPVDAATVRLSNGTNYKWRVRLYQPNADMLITYGLVQAAGSTTSIHLQPNINIKVGMSLTINNQTKTISAYNVDTGVATVSSAFSANPAVGTKYYVYSDFIETIPDYIVYARQTPTVSINNVPSSLTLKYHTFQGVYTQTDNIPIVYHQFDVFIKNNDGTKSLVTTTGKVYSANLSYTYDGFRTGNTYFIQMTVENDMGITLTTDMYQFNVAYDIVEYLQQPQATLDSSKNAIKVSWVTPVENEATSNSSSAANGTVQENASSFSQVQLETGKIISNGDVMQITNSDFDLVIDGNSYQETTTGKNLFSLLSYSKNGITSRVNDDGSLYMNGTPTDTFAEVTDMSKQITLKAGTYTFSIQKSVDYDITLRLFISNNKYQNFHIAPGETSITMDLIEDATRGYIYIYSLTVGANFSGTIYPQLESGDVATDFEKGTNGASPNPDYPREIEVVKAHNIYSKEKYPLKQGLWINGTATIQNNGGGFYVIIPIVGGKTYYVSKKYARRDFAHNCLLLCTTSTMPSNGVAQLDQAVDYSTLNKVFFKTSKDAKYLFIGLGAALTNDEKEKAIKELQVSERDNDYAPYECIGVRDDDGVHNFELESGTISSANGLNATTNTRIRTKNYIEYTHFNTLDFNGINQCIIFCYDENKKYLGKTDDGNWTSPPYNFTIINNTKYIRLVFRSSDDKTLVLNNIYNLRLYNQEAIMSINLKGNELCKIGDVKDELNVKTGVLTKKIGKYVFTGNETHFYITQTDNYIRFAFHLPINNIGSADTINCLCNTFKADTFNSGVALTDNNSICSWVYNGDKRVDMCIAKSLLTNLDYKAYFKDLYNNGTPVTIYYILEEPQEVKLEPININNLKVSGQNHITINANVNAMYNLVYPHTTITANAYDGVLFNPAGVTNSGIINTYNATTGTATFMTDRQLTYAPVKGDKYTVVSNIHTDGGFQYLYNTPYNTTNSLYTHGYTATWATPDGLCVLPDDFNITFQFSPDGNFYYDEDGVYQEVVNLVSTTTDGINKAGEFAIKIDKNKLIFEQNPNISLELPFYTGITQTFVLSNSGIAQLNYDYIWQDTATWNDNNTWVEGGTSLERICNHWWKVQITKTFIKIEEIFPTA